MLILVKIIHQSSFALRELLLFVILTEIRRSNDPTTTIPTTIGITSAIWEHSKSLLIYNSVERKIKQAQHHYY